MVVAKINNYRFIRWRVQVMERGVQLIDFVKTDSMVVIHDYKNASIFGRTQNAKSATKDIIKIMQDNYPEFLVSKYIYIYCGIILKIYIIVCQILCECTHLGKVSTKKEIYFTAKQKVNISYHSFIFKLIRPLLSEATTKKFVVCSK